jgi:hypothetical protein
MSLELHFVDGIKVRIGLRRAPKASKKNCDV